MRHFLAFLLVLPVIFTATAQQTADDSHILPKFPTQTEIQQAAQLKQTEPAPALKQVPVPANFVVPGEFEELQAVLIRWHYSFYSTGSMAVLYARLIETIQQECEVWILINSASDSNTVKNNLNTNGVTLTNYQFLVKNTNSIWVRDYGPWGMYVSGGDSMAFVDMQYYSSRPLDNQVPQWLANKMGIPFYASQVRQEGGNLMVDGFGHGYYSSRVLSNNQSTYGWAHQLTKDTLQHIMNLTGYTVPTTLTCDGGTGHIDMYAKLLDENSMVVSQYPAVVTASDKNTIESNVLMFNSVSSIYNRPMQIHRIDMPKRNDGSFSTSCSQIDNDARGFVNGLFVNKTFIFPSYSNTSTGDVAGDSAAIERYREILPGYNIVPIDARVLTPMGGAIHCITMQIPADNPIRFWHPPVAGAQPFTPGYEVVSRISNRSGIQQAKGYWRKKGSSSWNVIQLTDSNGYFKGIIPNSGFTTSDTIQYYLHSSSNNGKEMTKPFTAPDGFYTFYFENSSSYSVNFSSGTTYCPGDTISLPYTSTGSFGAGNQFQLQLSNGAGDFTTASVIGSANATAGNIDAILPQGLAAASGYRLRIVSTNPSLVFADSGAGFSVSAPAVPVITQNGNSLEASGSNGATYQWYYAQEPLVGEEGAMLIPLASGEFMVEAIDANNCRTLSDPFNFVFTGISGEKARMIKVYPNPAGQMIYIETPLSIPVNVEVYNALGQRVLTQKAMDGRKVSINVKHLSRGIYTLHVNSHEELFKVKLVKE